MKSAQQSLLSSVISSVRWVGLGIVVQVAIRVALLAIMARLVSPRDFGIVAIALIFTSFAERIGQVGVGAAFVQRAVIDEFDLKAAFYLSLFSGVAITALLSGIAPIAATFFVEPALRGVLTVLAFGFIVDSLGVVSDAMLQRELRFREIVKVETVSFAFGLAGVGILLGWLGCGLWALVGGNLAMRVCKAALLWYVRPVSLRGRWSTVHARSLLATGVGFSVGKVLNFLSLQGDNFIVGRVLGAEALGMYTRAYQAMTLPAMYVGQAFERVLFPALSQKQDDLVTLRRGLLSTLEISTLVALPASVGMHFLSPEIVLVLFGEVWRPVIPVLTILSCGVFFRAAYKCSDVLIRSKGDLLGYATRQVWYTTTIVVGAAIGAHVDGLQGVAYAVVLGVMVNYTLMTLLAGRLVRASREELLWVHVPGGWVAFWVSVVLAYIVPWLRAHVEEPFLILLVATGVGGGVAMLSCLLSGPLVTRTNAYQMVQGLMRRRQVA